MDNRLYKIVLKHQEDLKLVLIHLKVANGTERINEILNSQFYTILDCDDTGHVTKILKKSTNEVFAAGESFWHLSYNKWIDNLWFDEALSGANYFSSYYKNYVRADGGLYHLDQMAKENPAKNNCKPKSMTIDGVEYLLVKKEL